MFFLRPIVLILSVLLGPWLVSEVAAQAGGEEPPKSSERASLNLVEQVAVEVNLLRSAGELARVDPSEWQDKLDRLNRYERYRRVNGDNLPLQQYYALRAFIEAALGELDAALESCTRLKNISPEQSLSRILLGVASWTIETSGQGREAAIGLVVHAERLVLDADFEDYLSVAKASYGLLSKVPSGQSVERLCQRISMRSANLPLQEQVDLFYESPYLLGSTETIRAAGEHLLSGPLSDRQRLLVISRMLLQCSSASDEENLIDKSFGAETNFDFIELAAGDPVGRQAAASYLLFVGRFHQRQLNYRAAARAVERAVEGFVTCQNLPENQQPLVAWSLRLTEAKSRQFLATLLQLDGESETAEDQYSKIETRLQLLRAGISTDLSESRVQTAALDLVEYEYRVNRAQLLLQLGYNEKARGLIESSVLRDATGSRPVVEGLMLQEAKNNLAYARAELDILLQESIGKKLTSSKLSAIRDRLLAAFELADNFVQRSVPRQTKADSKAILLSDRQLAFAHELRGTARMYLARVSSYADPAGKMGIASDTLFVQALEDLRIAAEHFQVDPLDQSRAINALIYMGTIYEILADDDPESAQEHVTRGLESLVKALQIAKETKSQGQVYNAYMALARQTTSIQQGDSYLSLARNAATQAVVARRSMELDRYEVESFSEVFDVSIERLLAISNADSLQSNIAEAIFIMDRAFELAHVVDRPYSPRSLAESVSSGYKQLANQLQANEKHGVLVYYVSDQSCSIIDVTTSQIFRTETNRLEIAQLVSQFLDAFNERPPRYFAKASDAGYFSLDAQRALREKLLPDGLFDHLKDRYQRITVIRTGSLTRLPWDALLDEPELNMSLSYASSLSDVHFEGNALTTHGKLLSVAIPHSPLPQLPDLLQAGREAMEVGSHFGESTVLLDEPGVASMDGISTWLGTADAPFAFHVASHSVGDSNKALAKKGLGTPALVLVDREGKPEMLSTPQISKLNLGNCHLAIICSCESAVSNFDVPFSTGDSIANAFLDAGTKNVVASCWKVDDEASQVFLSHFAKSAFDAGLPYADALRSAREQLRQDPKFAHPYFWAPFVLLQ